MHRLFVLTPLAWACVAVSALAQTAQTAQTPHAAQTPASDTAPSPSADATLTLGAVRIDGRSSGALDVRRVFSSVDILGASLLEDQHVDYSWELFSRAPGCRSPNSSKARMPGDSASADSMARAG